MRMMQQRVRGLVLLLQVQELVPLQRVLGLVLLQQIPVQVPLQQVLERALLQRVRGLVPQLLRPVPQAGWSEA
jgi:hypothetical protein